MKQFWTVTHRSHSITLCGKANMELILYVIYLITVYKADCSRILLVFPTPSPSHHILGYALARGLTEAGHDVTMVSPYQEKNPPKRFRHVLLSGFENHWETKMDVNFFEMEGTSPFLALFFMNLMGNEVTTMVLENPNVQKLLNSNERFDAVIVDQFSNDALKVLAYHYKAPLIIFSTIGHISWVNNLIGNPAPPSYIPEVVIGYNGDMTFKQRLVNWLFILTSTLNEQLLFFPSQNRIMKRYFPDAPDLNVLIHNASVVFTNSHESIRQAVPHVPNLIDVGGFHLNPSKELPKDLKEFMDNATEGVVYFSMGSNIKPSDMGEEKKTAILTAFGKIKQKVLWKWDEETIPGKPENIVLSKWFPQQDILAHPNTKLFITHGGLLSTVETAYHGVPILGFPIYGDQIMNAARAEADGYGLYFSFSKITEEKLTGALYKLLNDPKYRENAKWRSMLMHDRPVKPMDLAVYWTEFVIRHKGAPHLRVAGVDLPWCKYFLLDVIAFVIVVSFGSLILLYLVVRKMFNIRKGSKNKLKKN